MSYYNSPIQGMVRLPNTDGTSFIQSAWQSASPTGLANNTTTWWDSTGRLNWCPGVIGTAFTRTFDATGVTANRVWTLPDGTTTLAGLSIQNQIFAGGSYAGTQSHLSSSATFANSSGTAVITKALNITYTINNTGGSSHVMTGLFLNATETSITGTTHYLIDLQKGGASKFKVDSVGLLTTSSHVSTGGDFQMTSSGAQVVWATKTKLYGAATNGLLTVMNSAENSGVVLDVTTDDTWKFMKRSSPTTYAPIAIGNNVTGAIGVASTHKVTMVIGGTTYYLLASNV